ncbi:uncharacterized protein [Littorina saxatilis]|uniref:Pseudouridine synthase I TruA alpha/beta domain-containing protein n=1 Tax=Littorina saxatilis TaxID=31220 RepID=A0AAN9G3F8_9CAEN
MASKRKAAILKGEKVPCQELRQYLYGVETYRQASMLRKGREVHKIYVDVHKGLSFMDDRFSLTEFGRMVLESGSVRAGRARNVRQIVVARETLYCSGTTGCMRACGGHGQCMPDCDKAKTRGHKCSFRVKLTMRLGFVDHWFVEILGSHNSFKDMGESPAATPGGGKSKASEPADYSLSGDSSLSPAMSDDLHHRDSPMPEVAALLRQNGASAAAAAAICEQYRSSPPVLYLSSASPLNIPVFPEPFSISAQHRHRQAVAAATAAAAMQPQLSSLDLSLKTEVDVAGTSSSVVTPDSESPMELTSKASVQGLPAKNGHVASSLFEDPSWPERNELLKSYLNSGTMHKNGTSSAASNSVSDLSNKSSSEPAPVKNYWTYQFSTPDLSPSPSPNEGSEDKTMVTEDEDAESSLVIDDERGSVEEEDQEETVECEAEDDKDLMTRVQQLEAHVTQLRHIVLKADKASARREKAQRQFDFNKYNTRHVALKVAYLGWDYQGFVVQEDSDKTVEAALFEAMLKTRLVETRETSNYHRCGRTDKGVSAFGQVISLDLRTNLLKGPGVKIKEGGTAHLRQGETATEIRYVHILNKVLPPDVRVLAWAPVEESFSARFSCKKRTYKYFFPKGNLDLELLSAAASKLVGEHDFRNLCKMDVGNGVTTFKRRIMHAEVAIMDERENGYSMCELTVVGQAFLWHQIRCIVAVLFLIAQGKEEPEIIEDLLNVDKCPRKPQYSMASELPLVLFDSDFGDDLEWVYEADWHEDNIRHLQQMWAQHAIRATMLKRMLEELDHAKVETESDIAPWNDLSAPVLQQCEWMLPGNKPRIYKPLLQRHTCESLEERIEHYAKRRKTSHPQPSAAVNNT